MADQAPETERATGERIAQAEAFIARHRSAYADEALHEQLRQAGYSDQEIRLAFGRLAGASPPRPADVNVALGLGLILALLNLALFPFAFLVAYVSGSSGGSEVIMWLILGLILLVELGLAYLLNRRQRLSGAWLLALLAPIAAHLLFFGVCISGGLR